MLVEIFVEKISAFTMERKPMPATIYAGAVMTISINSLFSISYRQGGPAARVKSLAICV